LKFLSLLNQKITFALIPLILSIGLFSVLPAADALQDRDATIDWKSIKEEKLKENP